MNCFIMLGMGHPGYGKPALSDALTGEAFQLEESGNTTILPAEPQEGLSQIKRQFPLLYRLDRKGNYLRIRL